MSDKNDASCIWLSQAKNSPDNTKSWNHPTQPGEKGSLLGPEMYKVVERAEFCRGVDPAEIPDWFYEPSKDEPFRPPNHAHLMFSGFWFISPEVRAVFDRFDMGANLIKPVVLYKSDQRTVAHDGYAVFAITEKKNAFLPEETPNPHRAYKNSTKDIWTAPYDTDEDKTMVFNSVALEGADLWFDERIVKRIFFFSDRLIQVLKVEGLVNEDWKLLRCPVLAG